MTVTSFDSCFFERQDTSPYKLPEYEAIKAEYYKPIDAEGLSKNDMLLVVADYNDYYFERLVYQNRGDSTLDIYGCGSPIELKPGKRVLALKKD